jgi:hypothetical protein
MRHTAVAVILGSFLTASLPAADQQLVNMVMPDAKIVAGVNVESTRHSPFGTFLLAQIPSSDPGLQKFITATGFNPQADLQEILMATAGVPASPTMALDPKTGAVEALASPKSMRGLIMARGNFNVEKISALAKSDGKQNVELYKDAMLISDPKDKAATGMALVGSNFLVAGTVADVKAAIDRRAQANALDPELTTKVNSLSASEDMWAVSIVPMSSLNPGAAAPAQMQGAFGGDIFKKITESSGGIKFGTLILMTTELVAMDEKNATALSDVLKFLVGMVAMNSGATKNMPPIITTILQSMDVQTQGNVVSVKMSAPEDQVEGLINAMAKAKPAGSKL